MKTASIALISAIALATPSIAEDSKNPENLTGAILEANKQYVFTLAESSRLRDFTGPCAGQGRLGSN
jgi:hypothetical protein